MRLGILGLPQAGKTTVFNALTGSELPVGQGSAAGKPEVHERVASIPDPRLDALVELLRPRKVTPAQVAVVDVDGLRVEAQGRALPGALIDHLAKADGLLAVVRAFEAPAVPHPLGRVDPGKDLEQLEGELLLNDQLAVERRLERVAEERQKGARDRAVLDREQALFLRLQTDLHAGTALRQVDLTAEEERLLAGFALLTRKPLLAVVNRDEQPPSDLPEAAPGRRVVDLAGRLEMEIGQLPPDEATAFLESYGMQDPGRERVLRECRDLLDLRTFFTVNEQEGKAWLLPSGATAVAAAATIHTDLARGFVRAEAIAWEQLREAGGLPQARAHGRLRLLGKDSPILDGDFVMIRSSV